MVEYNNEPKLNDLKLAIHTEIFRAKAENKKSINWKMVVPLSTEMLDDLIEYLKYEFRVNPYQVDGSILIEWD